jgi:hypothetical protein
LPCDGPTLKSDSMFSLKASTNRCAPDFVKDGIHMNAVDTGWVTDEDPAASS